MEPWRIEMTYWHLRLLLCEPFPVAEEIETDLMLLTQCSDTSALAARILLEYLTNGQNAQPNFAVAKTLAAKQYPPPYLTPLIAQAVDEIKDFHCFATAGGPRPKWLR